MKTVSSAVAAPYPVPLRALRLPDVIHKTGRSRSAIYQDVKNQTFPAPFRLGGNAVAWLESDVDQWLYDKVVASRAVQKGGK